MIGKLRCDYCNIRATKRNLAESSSGHWQCKSILACFNRLFETVKELRMRGDYLADACSSLARHENGYLVSVATLNDIEQEVCAWTKAAKL